jgi:hypothetical protein
MDDKHPSANIEERKKMNPRDTFTEEEVTAFAPAEKIGLVACVNPEGDIHMTLITSIMTAGPRQLTLGQFSTGLSKHYMQLNPDVGFLVMSMDKRLWRGTARWTHKRSHGPEYEIYNDQPMFRYNTYFGINTVHYLDLIHIHNEEKLPLGKIIPAAIITRIAKGAAATANQNIILKPFAVNLFNQLDALKFLAYIGQDGFPGIIPIIQCQAADSRRLVFSSLAFHDELQNISPNTVMGIFGLNLKMQSVFVRGIFKGFNRYRGATLGVLDIEWVYNSMPPSHGQIYPDSTLEPVTDF